MPISYQPLPQRVLRAHNRTSENYQWIQDNWDDISEKFTDKFVAVANREIVYIADTHLDLLKYISEHREQADLIGIHVRPNDRVLLR